MKNKKATVPAVANQNQYYQSITRKNLFGLTRSQWSVILDNLECYAIVGGFALLTFISLILAWFGECGTLTLVKS